MVDMIINKIGNKFGKMTVKQRNKRTFVGEK
jgi:hypothetical protein